MQMELGHQIADGGEVDPGESQLFGNKTGDGSAFLDDSPTGLRGQLEKVGQVGFGNQNEPRDEGVFVQQQMAAGETSQQVAVGS